jgi:hypothetical protein
MEFVSGSGFKHAFSAECDDVVYSPMADRRDEERQLSVRLTAKIIVAGRELPCRVHNISSGGANIETLANLTAEDRIRIEFRSNLSLAGKVRWQNGAFAGIEFTEPADVDAVLKKNRHLDCADQAAPAALWMQGAGQAGDRATDY